MTKPVRESFKVGPKKIGTLYRWVDGRTCLLLDRSRKDVHRGGNSHINHAFEAGEAMWSVETTVLASLRKRRVDCVAIRVREDGEVYITSLTRFMREGKFVTHRRRNGSAQRSLPVQRFLRKHGKTKF